MPDRVCSSCTTNSHLSDWIAANGDDGRCSFGCAASNKSVSIGEFSAHVDRVIRRYFHPHNPSGEFDDAVNDRPPLKVIEEVAGVSEDLAKRIEAIARRDDDHPSFYDFNLAESVPWPIDRSKSWAQLVDSLKHDARFFSDVMPILQRIFKDIRTIAGGAAIRKLTKETIVYRARRENSRSDPDRIFKSPHLELGRPSKEAARSGRMNAAGIRVFYGALNEEIAIAEVRPPVGSRVVVGAFAPIRDLQVLDLGALGWPRDHADVFSPNFDVLAESLTFLENLHQEISRPIQPYDEEIEYVPTQVVSEYVSNVLKLDGIAYRSAQAFLQSPPETNRNLVLFGHAAVSEHEPEAKVLRAGLRFIDRSQHMFDITAVNIKHRLNMWAHYADPGPDSDDTT